MEDKIKSAKINKDYTVVLTKEIVDRDGEVVLVDGMDLTNFEQNPVLIDSHEYRSSVIDRVLGKVVNLKKIIDTDGHKALVGNIEFAPTPSGQLAKSLVDGGFVKTVSIGFRGIWDGMTCVKSELFELSLVAIPANIGAMFKSVKGFEDTEETDFIKILNHYNELKSKVKVYRDTFLDNELWKSLDIEKTGDEIQDIIIVSDALLKEELQDQTTNESTEEVVTEENPQATETVQEENLPETTVEDQVVQILAELVKKI